MAKKDFVTLMRELDNPDLPPGAMLPLAAETVNDLELLRKSTENRLRQMTRDVDDKDGTRRGFGLTEDHPEVLIQAGMLKEIAGLEQAAIENLERLMKRHPLNGFIEKYSGLGYKTMGRLIGEIGDPYIRPEIVRETDEIDPATGKPTILIEPSRPRMVSELWSYCGLGVWVDKEDGTGMAPRRMRGMKSSWNEAARMRAYNAVLPMIYAKTEPYYGVFKAAQEKYAEAVHTRECPNCTPSGKKPAAVGTPLKPGHIAARARRIMMKTLLKDLWLYSKELHENGQIQN